MTRALSPGRGLRKFDQSTALADAYSEKFHQGMNVPAPGKALLALKRAASYKRIPLRVVALVDLLFSWTKPQDWTLGSTPIVWPSNALLAEKLGVCVRQTQNILKLAQKHGLIAFRDSPNGHRCGQRNEDGSLRWAYGIVLAPIAARYDEFVRAAEEGAAFDREVALLQRRLKACRRKVRELAQNVIDSGVLIDEATHELSLVDMAVRQIRGSRDLGFHRSCVEQMEEREKGFRARVAETLEGFCLNTTGSEDISCTRERNFMPNTTTNQPQSAKADTGRSLARSSSREAGTPSLAALTDVETDLNTHGVTPAFLAEVTPDLCQDLVAGDRSWGMIVATAERLTSQHQIPMSAWREACRIMGPRGAAASVLATVQKFRVGAVQRPGAYLRGMSGKAAKGELRLGRTIHGLKDSHAVNERQIHPASGAAPSIGAILRGRPVPTVRATPGRDT